MSSDDIRVGIADYKIGQAPHRIMTVGLGSCIGTIIYDEKSKVGGLSHIMLPDSKPFAAKSDVNPAKFADTAIPLMYQQLKRKVPNGRFKAKVVGGANMFSFKSATSGTSNIGQRNAEAVMGILKELRIPVVASHTGGNSGRTMIVDLNDFTCMVRIVHQDVIYI